MPVHLAFLAPPAPGHLYPTLPLVEELVRRGHRVSYATGHSMIPAVRDAGAHPVPLPTGVPGSMGPGTFTAEHLTALLEDVLADQRACMPVLDAHFHDDRPDAVCSDLLDATGRILAAKLSVPSIALVPNLAGNPDAPLDETFTGQELDMGYPPLVEVQQRMADFAAEQGLSDVPSPMTEVVAPLNLVFVPKEFQPNAATFDDRFRFLGPSLGHREHAEQWQPKDPARPQLFISLGTVFNDRPGFFRACVDAFGDSSWEVAMAVGDRTDMSTVGSFPGNFDIRPSFPQLAVLPHTNVFVTHAGMNSTMESLYFGVQMVAVPQVPEQRANARRIEELGLGRVLGEYDVDALRRAVDAVAADEQVRAATTRMRDVVRGSGGAAAGADAVEAYMASETPPR